MGIDLDIEDLAASFIAEQAEKHSRTGARALRTIFGKIINPLEFDPWGSASLEANGSGLKHLKITTQAVRQALNI
jgi:ATP-dependent protease Clp ATPase subunit